MSGKYSISQQNIYHCWWYDHNAMQWQWLWLGVMSSQKCAIGFVWCNPWSCEPLEAYGDIMRGEQPGPNMPWSGSKFSSKSSSNKIAKFERKTDCCRASSEIGWEHLISVLKSYNNWEDSEKFAKNAMQILCIKLEQLWWYIVELSCIHPASGSMESISMFEIWQASAGQGCTK